VGPTSVDKASVMGRCGRRGTGGPFPGLQGRKKGCISVSSLGVGICYFSIDSKDRCQQSCICAIDTVLMAYLVDSLAGLLGGDAVERLHRPPCASASVFVSCDFYNLPAMKMD